MTRRNWFAVGSCCLLVGVLLSTLLVSLTSERIVSSLLFSLTGGAVALVSIWPFWQASKPRPIDSAELEQQQLEFEATCRRAENELRSQAELLAKRERLLVDRSLQYQAWMEMPLDWNEEDDESRHQPPSAGDAAEGEEPTEWTEKDRQLNELLEKKAEDLFEKIKSGHFTRDGEFQLDLAREDALEFMTQVARVYAPDAENPLLETSVEQLLRAASRVCLQLLVLLERLPINIATYNLQSLHGYLQKTLKAYRVYQAVQPYMPYVQYATYAGRMVLGANPVALGAQWALWQLGTKGATIAAKHLINRQALSFVHDSITVLGGEVATVYGGDFRHRDRNWILAAELTELTSRISPTRKLLLAAFAEIGSLSFRSEYDRVFAYRCIALNRSANPERFEPSSGLVAQDRKWVADRLRKFAQRRLSKGAKEDLTQWSAEVADRLQVTFQVDIEAAQPDDQTLAEEVIQSLSAFLMIEREMEHATHAELLRETETARFLNGDRLQAIIEEAAESTDVRFELPELDSESEWVERLILDITRLSLATLDVSGLSSQTLDWIAEYYRVEAKRMRKLVEQPIEAQFAQQLSVNAPTAKLSAEAMLSILCAATQDSSIEFAYPDVSIRKDDRVLNDEDKNNEWILASINQRILLLSTLRGGEAHWVADPSAEFRLEKRMLKTTAYLSGGRWEPPFDKDHALVISRMAATGQESYFAPLRTSIQRVREQTSSDRAEST